jgi:hypothetical protein
VDEPRDIGPGDNRWQKSGRNNGVGYLRVWNAYLRGVHDFHYLVVVSDPRHEQVIRGFDGFRGWSKMDIVIFTRQGNRPTRPADGFTDSLWNVAESCWKPEPGDRPSASTVVEWLDRASNP